MKTLEGNVIGKGLKVGIVAARFIIACSTLYLTTHFLSIQAISGSSIARFWMHSNSFPKSINICGDFSVGWDLNKLRSIIPVTNVLPAERNIPYEKCFH